MAAQEILYYPQTFRVVERSSAVCCAVDDLELNRGIHLLVGAAKFKRLVDGHLRILISVQQEQRRVVSIDLEYGTGQPRERRKIVGLATQQYLERRHTNAQPVRSRLLQNCREIGRPIKTDDPLHF